MGMALHADRAERGARAPRLHPDVLRTAQLLARIRLELASRQPPRRDLAHEPKTAQPLLSKTRLARARP